MDDNAHEEGRPLGRKHLIEILQNALKGLQLLF